MDGGIRLLAFRRVGAFVGVSWTVSIWGTRGNREGHELPTKLTVAPYRRVREVVHLGPECSGVQTSSR